MKRRIACFVLTLLTVCPLCACGILGNSGRPGTPPAPVEKSPLERAIEARVAEYKALSAQEPGEEEKKLLSRTVTLTPEAAEAVALACAGGIGYAYEELFGLAEALRVYGERIAPYDGEILPILADGRLDADELYPLVKKNTAAYLSSPDTPKAYHELEDSIVRHACEVIAWTVNEELKNDAMRVNLDDLSYNLEHLSIVTGLSFDNAFVNEDGAMGLNPAGMESMNAIAGTECAYDCCISHEVEHLFQRRCNEARQDRFRMGYGFAYLFDGLAVNSLYNSWLTEACAEMLASRLYGIGPTTYRTKIAYANSLFLVNGLREDFDPYNAPRICLENDPCEAARRFGCETQEDITEFLTVLYSIDIVQEEPEDFISAYLVSQGREPKEGISDEELGSVKRKLKAGILDYLSEKFYANLAARIAGRPVTVEDLFLLLSVFECDLDKHIDSYTDEGKLADYGAFYDRYSAMQAAFLEALSGEETGLSAEQLTEAFYTFFGRLEAQQTSSFYETEWKQLAISWMSPEELLVLQQIYEDTISQKTVTLGEFLRLRESVAAGTPDLDNQTPASE